MLRNCLVLAAAACLALLLSSCVTIVRTGEEHLLTGEVEFSAGDNVDAIWESQALPLLTGKAVDFGQLLSEAGGDLSSVSDYGSYSMGASGELSFVVKGTATVREIYTESKAGYLLVQPEGYAGDQPVKLQIGSVYKGSAVRDCLDFIRFEDYKNQVDYAAVSQSIHDLIQDTVIDPLDLDGLEGQTVEFLGCFTVQSSGEILITPVRLDAAQS